MKRRCVWGNLWRLGFGVAILGVGLSNPPPGKAHQALLVSAAASLQTVLPQVNQRFVAAYPEIEVTYNFAASGTLQQQIERGAPVDIFISAGKKQMDTLQQKGFLLAGTRRNFLSNRLVLIVPKSSTLGLASFRQLTQANVSKIAVGEPRSVPVGQYTEELFQNLGLLGALKPKFVLGNSVRGVLAAVASGNVDAGVVYATDVGISNQVRSVATAPSRLHSPIVYPVAVLKGSQHSSEAKAYVRFLSSATAKAIFQRAGFGIAP